MININEVINNVSDKINRSNNYKYYGRASTLFNPKLLKEDELDDALGLTSDETPPENADQAPSDELPADAPLGDTQVNNGEGQPDLEPTEDSASDDTIDVDITQLVLKQDEMGRNVKELTDKIASLTSLKDELTGSLKSQIDQISLKVTDSNAAILDELRKRLPTKPEIMDLQSLHSYPYNIKLTDFWEVKPTENVNLRQNQNQNLQQPVKMEEPKEYILTQDDVNGFEGDIKNSF